MLNNPFISFSMLLNELMSAKTTTTKPPEMHNLQCWSDLFLTSFEVDPLLWLKKVNSSRALAACIVSGRLGLKKL